MNYHIALNNSAPLLASLPFNADICCYDRHHWYCSRCLKERKISVLLHDAHFLLDRCAYESSSVYVFEKSATSVSQKI